MAACISAGASAYYSVDPCFVTSCPWPYAHQQTSDVTACGTKATPCCACVYLYPGCTQGTLGCPCLSNVACGSGLYCDKNHTNGPTVRTFAHSHIRSRFQCTQPPPPTPTPPVPTSAPACTAGTLNCTCTSATPPACNCKLRTTRCARTYSKKLD